MEEKLEEMNQLYVASRHHLFQTSIATTLDTAKEGGWILAVARAFSTQLTSAMEIVLLGRTSIREQGQDRSLGRLQWCPWE